MKHWICIERICKNWTYYRIKEIARKTVRPENRQCCQVFNEVDDYTMSFSKRFYLYIYSKNEV